MIYIKKNIENIAVYIIAIMAAILLLTNFQQNIINQLSGPAIILVITLITITYFKENKNRYLLTYFIITLFSCFIIELAGSGTGFPTGYFSYGNILKPSLYGIPLALPIAYFGTILTSTALVQHIDFYWKQNDIIKSLLIGLLVLIFDIYMEPAAMKLGVWYWQGNKVALQNYITWYILSSILGFLGLRLRVLSVKLPIIFLNIYIAEVLFFVSMYFKK